MQKTFCDKCQMEIQSPKDSNKVIVIGFENKEELTSEFKKYWDLCVDCKQKLMEFTLTRW